MTGAPRECSLPGCSTSHKARGYCSAHYARWRRGTLAHGRHGAKDPIGYRTAHRRVCAARGPADAHRCDGCDGTAALWCYGGGDPAELVDGRGRRYSLDPDRYLPRCRCCQQRSIADAGALNPVRRRPPALDVDRAAGLYAAGASSRGIAELMGVSRNTVLRALRARGVAIRPPVAPQQPRRRRRRYPVTPRPTRNRNADPTPPRPISTNENPMPISTTTTPTTPQTTSNNQTPRARSDQRISDPSVVAARPAGPRHPNHKINETGGSRSC